MRHAVVTVVAVALLAAAGCAPPGAPSYDTELAQLADAATRAVPDGWERTSEVDTVGTGCAWRDCMTATATFERVDGPAVDGRPCDRWEAALAPQQASEGPVPEGTDVDVTDGRCKITVWLSGRWHLTARSRDDGTVKVSTAMSYW